MFMPMPQKQSVMDVFKGANPMAILLLGIVIGVIVVSMRPIVIQSMKP
jgi:type II secretory pathway component PulF